MSELATLARPYAEAAFKRAKEIGATAQWSDNLAFLSAVLSDSNIALAADNPKIAKESFLNLMLDICGEHLDQEGKNFLKLLIQNNRLKLAAQIAKIYEQFRADDEGYSEVQVISAYPLTEDEQGNLVSRLERWLNKQVRLDIWNDRSLIGGVLIRAGDKVIDGTVKGQLLHMQKALQ
ncbi:MULTISPECIES: F0F1 ATP synthase subunit delta [Methylotuvimicrobium]|jgi:F-type H+-transporting ATPase subunit delta|uniref:ATP synthase subunit delta n=1 Tax=Methylotuvimicrobium alcaliphilum (strain DSM 19304 / NCIMB 14124 / VKM B-2133 / 20Z) TaxID=1091494 RepID=G4SWW6_META2|nr:F0F1 ATP synthase subunit delta [Methylotuvimicrobium alcaliphilum]MBU2568518.1 F0F1 ATP synthase subunit delta [Gammaproteobacteria bacterium]CCE22032.1 ATP synthase subunit delta [Methylotuvimicrobium alcaliphilum 20Z]